MRKFLIAVEAWADDESCILSVTKMFFVVLVIIGSLTAVTLEVILWRP